MTFSLDLKRCLDKNGCVRACVCKCMCVCCASVQINKHVTFGNSQGSEESCILLHSMDVTMCDVAGNSSEVRKESVPEGTTCMLDPEGGDLSVMECVRKSWVYTGWIVAV